MEKGARNYMWMKIVGFGAQHRLPQGLRRVPE